MPDDKTQTRPQDSSRINIHEPYELRYWSERFGISEAQLKAVVQKVGVSVKSVEAELKHH